MIEKNTTERTIIPDKPKVIANEQLEIYIPEAAPGVKGVAEYSPVDFRVQNGVVRLRDSGKTAVQNFNLDFNTGVLTIYYTDGSELKTSIPTNYKPAVYTDSPFDILEFTESTFIQISNEEYCLLVDLNKYFGIEDDKYLAFLEVKANQQIVDEGEATGYYTLSDGIFKTNGKLVVSAIAPYEGRLLIVKEEHFEIHQILKALKESVQHSEIESTLSTTSINPVQNKIVTTALNEKLSNKIESYTNMSSSFGIITLIGNAGTTSKFNYLVSALSQAKRPKQKTSIVSTDNNGQILQGYEPTSGDCLANKNYVDNQITTVKAENPFYIGDDGYVYQKD